LTLTIALLLARFVIVMENFVGPVNNVRRKLLTVLGVAGFMIRERFLQEESMFVTGVGKLIEIGCVL